MKLAARDINGFLEAPQNTSAVLIYGPDRGQIRQYMDKVASKIVADLNDPFNKAELSADHIKEDAGQFFDELSAMSFTGDRRLIVVRDATNKLTDIMAEAMPLLHEQNYLIVVAGELDAKSSLRALFEKEKAVAALPCYKDEGAGLSTLISNTLRGYGIQAPREVIDYLSHHVGGDRMVILSELEKLSLYLGEDDSNLDLETAQKVIGDSADKSFDDLSQAIATGNFAALCTTIDRLYLEGMNPVAILRTTYRYFSRLLDIRMAMTQNQISADQAVKSARPPIFFKQQPAMIRAVQKWNEKRLQQVLHLLMETEKDVKLGGETAEVICAQTLLRVARVAV